jgi:PAS domain S-box-containing protein
MAYPLEARPMISKVKPESSGAESIEPELKTEPLLPSTQVQDLAHLKAALDESTDCIKVLDLNARLLSMNEGGMQTMEIGDFQTCQNLLWPDFWQGEDRLKVEAALERARLGERSSFEGQANTFQGTPRWWEVRVAPIVDEQGAVQHLLAISRDITARKKAQLALQALNATLEAQVEVRVRQSRQDDQVTEAFVAFTEAAGNQTDAQALAEQAVMVLRERFADASVGYYVRSGEAWTAQVWSDDLTPDIVARITAGAGSEHPIIAEVLKTRKAVFVDAPPRAAAAQASAQEGQVRSLIYQAVCSVPMKIGAEVCGLLSVGFRTMQIWRDQDRQLVQAVGSALNLALERADNLRRLTEHSGSMAVRNAELEQERTFLNTVLANLSEGVVACDTQGQLTLFNDASRHFHGLDVSAIPPEEWAEHYDLFEGDGVTPLITERIPLVRAWKGEELHEVEMTIRPKGGESRQFLASGQPMFTASGRPVGAVVTMRDVTVRLAAEQQLAQSNEQLLRINAELLAANEELEAFAYSASHDLRTPVRHVQSFAQLARRALDQESAETAVKHLGFVEQAAGRMSTLIDAMLQLSRSTRQELRPGPVALEPLLRQTIKELELDTVGRQMQWNIADLPTVSGDRVLLGQVLTNLLSNALKFSGTREQTLIEIWATEDSASWSLFVRDNGVGFESKYTERLFGVFQRLHTDREFQGTGVGLATVRRIVLRHGGTVFASGTPDVGATFGFTLPKGH